MIFGATLSHRELAHLGVELSFALSCMQELPTLKVLRVCGYWDELQPSPTTFDFSAAESLLKFCQREKKEVVFTIGLKAPRWPEFHQPSWLSSVDESGMKPLLFSYIDKVVEHFHSLKCINYWQVENEPLDPSGPHRRKLSSELLKAEVDLVRSLDPSRPIITTLWGNTFTQRNHVSSLAKISNIVGVDLYWKVPFAKFFYTGPSDSVDKMRRGLRKNGKPYWIAELQAEPWEHSAQNYLAREPKSFNIAQLKKNIDAGIALQPEVILFWGIEYWLWRRLHGDEQFWQEVKQILETLSPSA